MRRMYARYLVTTLLFVLCCSAICAADFDGHKYIFAAYYDDLPNPGFEMSFDHGVLSLDVPELDQGRNEEGIYLKAPIRTKYATSKHDGYFFLTTTSTTYAAMTSDDGLICILYDLTTGDSFWGVLSTSKFIRLGATPRGTWVGIVSQAGASTTTTSSFLVEKSAKETVQYDGTGRYYYGLNKWVEGKKGAGIGEWIEKKIEKKTDTVVLINGYVDPRRPDLFKKNARIKTCEITTSEGSWMFTLEDKTDPQILHLPQKIAGKVRLTIREVFPGTAFEDTVLSGFYFLVSPKEQ